MSKGQAWSSRLSPSSAAITILAAWFSVWFVGLCMTLGTAAGSALLMLSLVSGEVPPFSAVPQGIALLLTVELWELFGMLPIFRFWVLLLGYVGAGLSAWQILRAQDPP